MAVSTAFKLFLLLLPALISAQSCTYNGQSLANRGTADTNSGCGKIQCQSGVLVQIVEACGKETDGLCHYFGSLFLYKGVYYRCNKRLVDKQPPIYVAEEVGKLFNAQCRADGVTYNNLDTLLLNGGCRSSQCQGGSIVDISPAACDKSLDGCCHLLNSYVFKDDKVYKCVSKEVNGKIIYEYQLSTYTPDQCSFCIYNSKKYTTYDVYRNADESKVYQCQDGNNVLLSDVCTFPFDGNRYTEDTVWKYQNKLYECVRDSEGNLVHKEITQTSGTAPCVRNSQRYDHLQNVSFDGSCVIHQCQNGRFVQVYPACKDRNNVCRPLNSIWQEGNDVFKCIDDSTWGYTVVRVTGDNEVPICGKQARDIILVLDNSGSIGAENFEKQKRFTAKLTEYFFVGSDARNVEFQFGAVTYSTDVVKEFDLNAYTTQSSLAAALLKVPFVGQWTRTDKALNYVVDNNLFAKGRSNAGDVVLVVTDGKSDIPEDTQIAAKRLRDLNIEIFALGIGKAEHRELNGITKNPNNVFYVSGFDDLNGIAKTITAQICSGGNPVVPIPPPAPTCTKRAKDVVFLLDNSGSIGEDNFIIQKKFTARLAERFDIGTDSSQGQYLFGAISFSTDVVKEFDLNTYTTKSSLKSALLGITYVGLWTYTDQAFNYIVDKNVFSKGRPDADNLVVLITDGKSNYPEDTLTAAARVRKNKIDIIAVGIAEANKDELNSITNNQNKVFYVKEFSDLTSIEDKLTTSVCTDEPVVPAPEPEPEPTCKNIGKDIIFVLDTSGSIGKDNFELQKQFTSNVVQQFAIGNNPNNGEYAFGSVLFSTDVTTVFELNKYSTKSDISKALLSVRYLEGHTYTDLAFDHILRTNMFSKGRKNADDVVCVITDGKSAFPDYTAQSAKALRNNNIKIVAVGIGDADQTELKSITNDPSSVLYVKSFNDLGGIVKKLTSTVCS